MALQGRVDYLGRSERGCLRECRCSGLIRGFSHSSPNFEELVVTIVVVVISIIEVASYHHPRRLHQSWNRLYPLTSVSVVDAGI